MAEANSATGERVLVANGVEYRLTYTTEALMMAETATKLGPYAVIDRISSGLLTITELVALLSAGIEGHGRRHEHHGRTTTASPKPREIMRVIDEVGYINCCREVMASMVEAQSLADDLDTDQDSEGSAEAPKAGLSS